MNGCKCGIAAGDQADRVGHRHHHLDVRSRLAKPGPSRMATANRTTRLCEKQP